MTGIVYAYRNKVNGKYYVGQTVNPDTRHRYHMEGRGKGAFHNAVRKYGAENFQRIVLKEGIASRAEMDLLERYYIKHFESFKHGYNMTLGGDGITSEAGKKIWSTPEAFEKKSRAMKVAYQSVELRKQRSEITRKAMADPVIRERHLKRMHEVTATEEWKAKNAERGRRIGRPVICIESGTQFYGGREVQAMGIARSAHVCAVCKGKRKTAGGFHWRYAEVVRQKRGA